MNAPKQKIINDPVYGFIKMPTGKSHELVEHAFFQRLRRIRQLGLTFYVYPGAIHTRFQHTLGATHLMHLALDTLKSKDIDITDSEYEATVQAILLHDIGHGPFSHSLERSIIQGVSHEDISEALMGYFNDRFDGHLDLAIKIFKNEYPKRFLHQLVSSQLDVDRLDYLLRDSFFTGVSEGIVGSDRILKMLNISDQQLVVESKGVYSIEKFLIARRLMYWQVYLHKTVIVAEQLLLKVLQRAQFLALNGTQLFATPTFSFFLYQRPQAIDLQAQSGVGKKTVLELFMDLDDNDILTSIKVWCSHSDPILSFLSTSLIDRHFYHIELQNQAFDTNWVASISDKIKSHYSINDEELSYYLLSGAISNHAYSRFDDRIHILQKNKTLIDIAEASDILDLSALSKKVEKHFVAYPKIFQST